MVIEYFACVLVVALTWHLVEVTLDRRIGRRAGKDELARSLSHQALMRSLTEQMANNQLALQRMEMRRKPHGEEWKSGESEI